MKEVKVKNKQCEKETLKINAINWFIECYQSDEISIHGGYFGGYKIYDNKLFLITTPNQKGGEIKIFEIIFIIKLYKKYKNYTHNLGYNSFKSEFMYELLQFFEEINNFKN